MGTLIGVLRGLNKLCVLLSKMSYIKEDLFQIFIILITQRVECGVLVA